MPSVASEVNASLSLPPSQRPRPQSAGSESAPQPFASLLDATAPAPEAPPEPDLQNPPQRTEPPVPTAGRHADNAPAKAVTSSSDATSSPKLPDSKKDARVGNKDDKPTTEAAKSDAKAKEIAATPAADDGKDKATDTTAGKDATADATPQIQAPITPQPVAVAVDVTGLVPVASAPASDATKTGAIDADKSAKPEILDPADAPAADAKDAAVSEKGTGVAQPTVPDGKGAIPTPGNQPAKDAKARPVDEVARPADGAGDKTSKAAHTDTANAIEPAGSNHSEARHEATPDLDGQGATAGSAGDQHQAAVKPNTDALPNFGFSTSNIAAASPSTASAPIASVPIAGLAVEIAARAQAGTNRFDIRLDPPELGRIDVRLDVNRDGQVTSHVTVDRPETLTLLRHEQPNLERALEQAGLKTADNGLQFTLRDQSFTGQDNGGRSGQNTARLVIPDADLGTVETITSRYRSFGVGGGVDISV